VFLPDRKIGFLILGWTLNIEKKLGMALGILLGIVLESTL
jgi:hypothetical protein